MKASAPIITCDDESGCIEWEIDYYEMTVTLRSRHDRR